MKAGSKKIAGTAILTALALIAFMLESLFPPIMIPGAKLGLGNLFTLLALLLYGGGWALVTVLVRCVLGSLFTGNPSAIMYSLPAGLVSFGFEFALMRFAFGKISVIAASVGAAVLHNAVQNAIFCLVTGTPQAFAYLPYLALIGVAAGLAVGAAAHLILKLLPMKYIINEKDRQEEKN